MQIPNPFSHQFSRVLRQIKNLQPTISDFAIQHRAFLRSPCIPVCPF
jgi:hypothetical protein